LLLNLSRGDYIDGRFYCHFIRSKLNILKELTILLQTSYQEMSNMDNQKKILVNRIYEQMQTVDKSIDDKRNKLFKILEELASLSEQARVMQYEINQLNTEQAENMCEFLLLCEHLDTYPKRNSNAKGNITPNKVAGDFPLASSAKNIYVQGRRKKPSN